MILIIQVVAIDRREYTDSATFHYIEWNQGNNSRRRHIRHEGNFEYLMRLLREFDYLSDWARCNGDFRFYVRSYILCPASSFSLSLVTLTTGCLHAKAVHCYGSSTSPLTDAVAHFCLQYALKREIVNNGLL